jgi:hypothetical protein
MSKLEVDAIEPQSGTTLTLGDGGDTIDVPGTEIKTNKVSPTSGTTLTLGDSGDTITIPSGATVRCYRLFKLLKTHLIHHHQLPL